ncbi:hypothetical protein NQZ68_017141 [Dissostichus eleginoides]|nr:hypothetical protein NQZ68_017141 [Dissostichus eleginoides]
MASESGESNMDREMILADFQACTGIDNIAEAITLLELNNWDLVAAINGVIPQENGILQSNFSSEASQAGMFGPPSQSEAADAAAGGAVPTPSSSSLSSSPPSSSTSAFCPVNSASSSSSSSSSRQIVERQPRMLNFRVEYRQRTVDLVLEEGSTVGEIKKILETELAVPVSKMQLKGWKSGDVSDTTVMRSLHLPKNNSLYVLTPEIAPTASTSTSKNSGLQESLNQNFLLVISHREAQRDYSLNFPGSKTIQEADGFDEHPLDLPLPLPFYPFILHLSLLYLLSSPSLDCVDSDWRYQTRVWGEVEGKNGDGCWFRGVRDQTSCPGDFPPLGLGPISTPQLGDIERYRAAELRRREVSTSVPSSPAYAQGSISLQCFLQRQDLTRLYRDLRSTIDSFLSISVQRRGPQKAEFCRTNAVESTAASAQTPTGALISFGWRTSGWREGFKPTTQWTV